MISIAIILLSLLIVGIEGLNNGLATTPAMGYNSWYDCIQ
jgi:hypothetical protein